MNIKAVMLEQEHLDELAPKLQPNQRGSMPERFADLARAAGPAVAFIAEGEVIAAGGLIDTIGTGRAVIWVMIAGNTKRHFLSLFMKCHRMLAFYPRRRLEAHIDPLWPEARRLVKLMGFKCEGLMEAFENGSDRELWALVKRENGNG